MDLTLKNALSAELKAQINEDNNSYHEDEEQKKFEDIVDDFFEVMGKVNKNNISKIYEVGKKYFRSRDGIGKQLENIASQIDRAISK